MEDLLALVLLLVSCLAIPDDVFPIAVLPARLLFAVSWIGFAAGHLALLVENVSLVINGLRIFFHIPCDRCPFCLLELRSVTDAPTRGDGFGWNR